MPLSEIFSNPLVKSVAFEIRFPNLFYLEGRIGDFQMKIMREFPQSELALRRHVVFAAGETRAVQEVIESQKEEIQKLWRFKSGSGVELAVTSNSLHLISERHKSYSLGAADRFRDVIQMVTEHFIAVAGLPIIQRAGLRYIDHAPVFEKTTRRFEECYQTALPLRRFPLESGIAMDSSVVVQKAGCQMRYVESLQPEGTGFKLVLDFDAWAENIEPAKLLETTDRLHDTISDEFLQTVREPVLEFMRRPAEVDHGDHAP